MSWMTDSHEDEVRELKEERKVHIRAIKFYEILTFIFMLITIGLIIYATR